MSTTIDRDRLVPPSLTKEEAEMVRAAERLIMASLDHSRSATITIKANDGSTPSVEVPPQVLRVLGQTLGLLTKSQPVFLMPEKQELTTVEAAHFLNVSRPFVIKEIETGRLKHRMVGKHRRILFIDLVEYDRQMRAQQQSALDRMADDARELGLEY